MKTFVYDWFIYGVFYSLGVRSNITIVTSNMTMTKFDHTILVDASGGNIQITLPNVTNLHGFKCNIKKIDSSINEVSIIPTGTETIDGQISKIIKYQNSNIHLQTDGINWYIL